MIFERLCWFSGEYLGFGVFSCETSENYYGEDPTQDTRQQEPQWQGLHKLVWASGRFFCQFS